MNAETHQKKKKENVCNFTLNTNIIDLDFSGTSSQSLNKYTERKLLSWYSVFKKNMQNENFHHDMSYVFKEITLKENYYHDTNLVFKENTQKRNCYHDIRLTEEIMV